MGNKNLKAVLLIVTAIAIILFTGTAGTKETSAKASDFKIEGDVLTKYSGSEKEVDIPNGVKTIGAGAFKECMVEKVTIPVSVSKIENEAFQNCSKLIEIVIPDGVNYIGHYAFMDCTSLEMIDLPDSIGFIGGECFENCTNLETILFPTQECFFGYKAFNNTLWLNNYEGDYVMIYHTLILYLGNEIDITIPDNVTVIGYGAFQNCSFITNVNIPMGVMAIGYSAFEGCKGLSEIVLPDSVIGVCACSFKGCSNLAKITMAKDVNISLDSLEGTKWMEDYQGDFIMINGNLLGYRGSDFKVIIPDNITTVCSGAFNYNDIVTEVTVPESVMKINYAGFNSCNNLQKVFITGKKIHIEDQAFLSCSSNLKLYGIESGTVKEYSDTNNIQFASLGLNKTKVTLYIGGDNTTSLIANGIEGKVQWVSEDATIAKVGKSGKVTAVKKGTTKINAIVNGITMTCEVTVKYPFINKSTVSILVGQTSRLNIVGISSGLKWSSSNKLVASVSSAGVITAKKAGKATIIAIINGKKYTCMVTVK